MSNESRFLAGNQILPQETAIELVIHIQSGDKLLLAESLAAAKALGAVSVHTVEHQKEVSAIQNWLRENDFARSNAERTWHTFLHAGDIIRPHALHTLLRFICENENVRFVYSDHDYLRGDQRVSPCFKPDWAPTYHRFFDYISRARFVRGDLLIEHSGSLVGKSVEADNGRDPAHIPDILFSFRDQDSYFGTDAINSTQLDECLAREIIADETLVTLVIPTRDRRDLLERCIDSIRKTTNPTIYKILIIDNDSTDPKTLQYLSQIQEEENCRILHFPGAFNFAAMNNAAVNSIDTKFVCLLNNDIEVRQSGWLEELLQFARQSDIGCVGPKLIYPDERIQHGGVICGVGNIAGHAHRFSKRNSPGYCHRLSVPNEFSAITAACLLVSTATFRAVGGMEERRLAVAYNDVDLCLKVSALGKRNILVPQVELIHFESVSRGQDVSGEKKLRYEAEVAYMKEKWQSILDSDPYYNVNLSKVREDFSVDSDPPTWI